MGVALPAFTPAQESLRPLVGAEDGNLERRDAASSRLRLGELDELRPGAAPAGGGVHIAVDIRVLVRDEGVQGVVLRLSEPAFTRVDVEGKRVRAGTGAAVSTLVSAAARHNLAGLEYLVGVPGTVGGSLRRNAADRTEEFAQYLRRVEVIDAAGNPQTREKADLRQNTPSLVEPTMEPGTHVDEGPALDA